MLIRFARLYSKKRGLIFTLVGLMLFAIAVGVTFGTFQAASSKGGLYIVYVGKDYILVWGDSVII